MPTLPDNRTQTDVWHEAIKSTLLARWEAPPADLENGPSEADVPWWETAQGDTAVRTVAGYVASEFGWEPTDEDLLTLTHYEMHSRLEAQRPSAVQALLVLVRDPAIRDYLAGHDPKALAQAVRAIDATGITI